MTQSHTADERRPLPPGLPAVSVPLDAVYIDDKHSRCYVLKSALTALDRVVPDGWQLVPKAALEWLFGEAPDGDGKWFGETEDAGQTAEACKEHRRKRPYWWRSRFRAMLDAQPVIADQREEATNGDA